MCAISRGRDGKALSKQCHLENADYDANNRMNIEKLAKINATRQQKQRVNQRKSTRKRVNKVTL